MAIPALLAALGRGAAGTGAGGAVGGIGKALEGLKGAAGGALNGINRLNAGVAKLGTTSHALVSALAAGSNAIKGIAAPLAQFVGLRAPVAVTQFTLAVRDMDAAIGQILLPVFNSLTQAARLMGDTYATIGPKIQTAMKAIGSTIVNVVKEMGAAARENAPAIELMSKTIGLLAEQTSGAAAILGKVMPFLTGLPNAIGRLLGLGGLEEKSARGMAVRNISIGSSGEDVARKAQEAAFSAALNGGEKKEDPQVSLLKDIHDKLKEIYDRIPTVEDVKSFLNSLGGAPGSAGKAVVSIAGGIPLAAARAAASNLTR